jgi:tol-pal system protein YbgF
MTKRWFPLVLLLILCVVAGLGGPARAQSGDVNQLYHEIERLRQDLRDLQAHVFSPDQAGVAPEMTAGAAAEGQSPARLAADLEYRMGLVDEQFRMMTGQFEELGHRILLLEQRIEKLVADMDFRLGELEQAAATPLDSSGASASAPGGETAYPSVDDLVEGSPALSAEPAPLLPAGTDQEQYEYALGQVRTMQQNAGTQGLDQAVDAARRSLEEFLARNPESALAVNASYWLGEVHYFAQDYERAMVIFARNYEKTPSGRKAPENLLKLAMSLSNLGRASDACQALREMRAKFPDGNENLAEKANAQWSDNGCE